MKRQDLQLEQVWDSLRNLEYPYENEGWKKMKPVLARRSATKRLTYSSVVLLLLFSSGITYIGFRYSTGESSGSPENRGTVASASDSSILSSTSEHQRLLNLIDKEKVFTSLTRNQNERNAHVYYRKDPGTDAFEENYVPSENLPLSNLISHELTLKDLTTQDSNLVSPSGSLEINERPHLPDQPEKQGREEKKLHKSHSKEFNKLFRKDKYRIDGISLLPTDIGLRLSSISSYNTPDQSVWPINGFSTGLYLQYVLREKLRFQVEMNYSYLRKYRITVVKDYYYSGSLIESVPLNISGLQFYELQASASMEVSKRGFMEAGLAVGMVKRLGGINSSGTSVDFPKGGPYLVSPDPIYAVLLGYGYKLGNRMSIGGKVHWGLSDLSRDEFQENANHRVSWLEISCKYQLSKPKEIVTQ